MMGYNRQPTYHARTVTALCIKALTGLESRNWPIIPLVIKEQPASSVVSCRIRIALRLYIPPRAQIDSKAGNRTRIFRHMSERPTINRTHVHYSRF